MEDDGIAATGLGAGRRGARPADLNGFLKALIRAIPDSAIDAALKTDDVLTRAIEDLDLRTLLANLDDQDDLNEQVEAAVTQAVKDSLPTVSATCSEKSPYARPTWSDRGKQPTRPPGGPDALTI